MSKVNNLKKVKSLCYLVLGGTAAHQVIYYKRDFNGYYKNVLQPISQKLNPELAHSCAIFAIKHGLIPIENYEDPKILHTSFLNRNLSNPLGVAAGFDKHADAIIGLRNLGFGIVEVGSVTPLPQPGNEKPRVFRLPEDQAVINRYGFNSEGHDRVYSKIKDIDKSIFSNGLFGVNLGKNATSKDALEDYVKGIRKFKEHADYFVINISSPNTAGLRSLQKKDELSNLLIGVNKVRQTENCKVPLLIKLAPDLTADEDIKDVVQVITKNESRVDGLIISNTTIDRTGLLNKEHSNETGGLSGKPLTNKSTEMIKNVYRLTKGKIPIIGVGGVFSGQDAFEKILAGASVVQVYTALIYHGPGVVTQINKELAELLEKHGYKSVNDAVGKGT